MKYFTPAEAKTRFGEFIETGIKSGVCLTRNGRAAGYLVPANHYEQGEIHPPSPSGGFANGIEEILTQYSLGKIPRLAAMQQAGIADYGQLLRLLNAAGLPHPIPKEKDRRKLDLAFDAFMAQTQPSDTPA